jgi:hypothetical protein
MKYYKEIKFKVFIFQFLVTLPQNSNFTAIEYLFFPKATMNFGFLKGYACITGWILIIILLIMAAFAQPCIRRSNKFEV